MFFNPIVLRMAKIVCNFGLSECNRVKGCHIKFVKCGCFYVFFFVYYMYRYFFTYKSQKIALREDSII